MNLEAVSSPAASTERRPDIRNIAIIAHVDHGKTTLVDALLRQSGIFRANEQVADRVMDSNAIERERGLTILAKNTAVTYGDVKINIMDTPGHADFGGEVERTLAMVDGVLLLVDASEGPLPQTRFVLRKALERGLTPIVCINKIDRPDARIAEVLDEVYGLFIDLDATEEQLEFPVVYTVARDGIAKRNLEDKGEDLRPLFDVILSDLPGPEVQPGTPTQFQANNLDYDDYVGRLALGRVVSGELVAGQTYALCGADGVKNAKLTNLYGWIGLKRINLERATAGDIVAVAGMDDIQIGDTVADRETPIPLPRLRIDEPTITMIFGVNTSPWAGREGQWVTSRKLRERLENESKRNVSIRLEDTEQPDRLRVSGRGELQLAILVETMRREGYELAVSRPEVIIREIDGVLQEPIESLVVDMEEQFQGGVMGRLGERKALLQNMEPDGKGRVRLDYLIPARGLIGFQTEFRTLTAGTGLLFHVFDHYGPKTEGSIGQRQNGVLISNGTGPSPAYAQIAMQERGRLFIEPGEEIYEGQIVGIHSKDNDLTVNALRGKQLTNFRASGKDDDEGLIPPIKFSLEQALEFIDDDELVEVTPRQIRLRKKLRTEVDRKRASRAA